MDFYGLEKTVGASKTLSLEHATKTVRPTMVMPFGMWVIHEAKP